MDVHSTASACNLTRRNMSDILCTVLAPDDQRSCTIEIGLAGTFYRRLNVGIRDAFLLKNVHKYVQISDAAEHNRIATQPCKYVCMNCAMSCTVFRV